MWCVTRPSPTPKSLLGHHQRGLEDKRRLLGPCCRGLAYEDVVCAWHCASHITWIFSVNPHNNSIHRNCYYCEGSERLSGMPKKLAGAGLKPHNLMWERIVLYCLYHFTTNYKCCRIPQNGGMSEQWSSLEGLSGKGEGLGGAQRSGRGKKPTCFERIWHVCRQGQDQAQPLLPKDFLTFLLKSINSVN